MKIINIDQNSPEWYEFRKGKATGSKLKDLVATGNVTVASIKKELDDQGILYDKKFLKDDLIGLLDTKSLVKIMLEGDKKKAYYQLIADRMAVDEDTEETAMERGSRLEPEALAYFNKQTGLNAVTSGVWVSDDNDSIMCSPDGAIFEGDKITGAVEIKCLNSAEHVEALLEKKIPEQYDLQKIQYFIVNESLETLYFVLYDPRITAKPHICFKVTRDMVKDEIEQYREYQSQLLVMVDKAVEQLTF